MNREQERSPYRRIVEGVVVLGGAVAIVAFMRPEQALADTGSIAVTADQQSGDMPILTLPGNTSIPEDHYSTAVEGHLPASPESETPKPAPATPQESKPQVPPPVLSLPGNDNKRSESTSTTQNRPKPAPWPQPADPKPQAPPVSLPGNSNKESTGPTGDAPQTPGNQPAAPPAVPPATPPASSGSGESSAETTTTSAPPQANTDPNGAAGTAPKPQPTSPPPPPATPKPAADVWVPPIEIHSPTVRCGSGYMTPDRPDHLGQDLPAVMGTPVVAPFDGIVKRAGPSSGYGDAVDIYDPVSGLYVELGHIQGPTIKVHEGETVKAGEEVALSGNEGQSSGPHLHVGVSKGFFADRIDPNQAFRDHGSQLC